MGGGRHPGSGVSPELPIPLDGLDHVLRGWIGRGELVAALAGIEPDGEPDWQWSDRDIRARAEFVLFRELLPELGRWPTSWTRWADALPARSLVGREHATSPRGAVQWVETRRRYGWPPGAFVERNRRRIADPELTSVLAWVLGRVVELGGVARGLEPTAGAAIERQLTAAAGALDVDPLAFAPGGVPRAEELRAARGEGGLWVSVVRVAEALLAAEEPDELARRLLVPELRSRFFQLGVLGTVLAALRDLGARTVSLRPLGGGGRREHYRSDVPGLPAPLQVWFEAGGMWAASRHTSPYVELARGLPGGTRPLSPDLLLIDPGRMAIVVECKYSADPEYVGRTGIAQTALYAAELRARLAPRVHALLVVPDGVLVAETSSELPSGPIHLCEPRGLPALLHAALRENA